MTFLALALLGLLTLALLLLPVIRRGGSGVTAGIEVYRDQLDELERDHQAGLIDKEGAAAARREIERRLLKEDERRRSAEENTVTSGSGRSMMVVVVSAAVLVLGVALYAALGAPGLSDQPLAARLDTEAPEGGNEMTPLIARAEARTLNEPFNLEAWALLANAYAFAERYSDAANAMSEAAALDPQNAATLSALGEFITLSRSGTVTPAARVAFSRALTLNPEEPVARYYEGVARAQDGDVTGALAVWRSLLAQSSSDAPWAPQLRLLIADAETMTGNVDSVVVGEDLPSGPSQKEIEAASELPPEDQLAMIRSMVDGLAERLEDEPDNLEGWMRLGQSYAVLGEWRLSRDAYDHALTLMPGDQTLLNGLSNAVAGTVQAEPVIPDWALADMERVLAVLPDNPEALFVTGMGAIQRGDDVTARRNWTRLRNLLPEGSVERSQAQGLIDNLP